MSGRESAVEAELLADVTVAEEGSELSTESELPTEAEEALTPDVTDYVEPERDADSDDVDYEQLEREDIREIHELFPEARGIESITELENPERYAALRDLGLSPKEAYLATGRVKRAPDNRRHLSSAVPRGAGAPGGSMTRSELERARDLFPGLGDRELMGLYRKVSV